MSMSHHGNRSSLQILSVALCRKSASCSGVWGLELGFLEVLGLEPSEATATAGGPRESTITCPFIGLNHPSQQAVAETIN